MKLKPVRWSATALTAEQERDRLQVINAELVKALGIALQQLEIIGDGWDKAEKAVRAATAKAWEPGDG